ncbi:MAG: hypothetical protein AABW91_01755 [Nanoarchaeota archaeon]
MLNRNNPSQIEKIEFQEKCTSCANNIKSYMSLAAILTGGLIGLMSVPIYLAASTVFLPVAYLNNYFSNTVNTKK